MPRVGAFALQLQLVPKSHASSATRCKVVAPTRLGAPGFEESATKASTLYRAAAVLLLLFAIGHTIGFSQSDPDWKLDPVLSSMRSVHFQVQGFHRTYWDFFLGAGFTVGVLYLFAAVLAWQLASLRQTMLRLGTLRWAFACTFAVIAVLSFRYLFVIPIVFSALITLCLASAAWLSSRDTRT